MSKKFSLIGAAGYIAPRHMIAIKDNGCDLVAAVDPNDSVGILDSYFLNTSFFNKIETFDRHIDKLKRTNNKVDYCSVCSPNYLHDSHIRLGLRNDMDVICEKPIVIKSKNIKYLKKMESETSKNIYTILQMRLHDSIVDLKKHVSKGLVYDVDLKYITTRGLWYDYSWKGDHTKSGGVCMNIGIHFFDVLLWIFGECKSFYVTQRTNRACSGILNLERANVRWQLSVDYKDLPKDIKDAGMRMYRSFKINNKSFDFNKGFENLHTKSYHNILNGNGFRISESEESIGLVNKINEFEI